MGTEFDIVKAAEIAKSWAGLLGVVETLPSVHGDYSETLGPLGHGPFVSRPAVLVAIRDWFASSPAPAGLDVREYVSCTRTHAPETTHYHPMRVKAAIDRWEDARAAPAPAGLDESLLREAADTLDHMGSHYASGLATRLRAATRPAEDAGR
jgi:hypothetical protein